MGFVAQEGVSQKEICAAAEQHGLLLCPPEVAVQLWLQYPDLLFLGDWTLVALKPVSHSVVLTRECDRYSSFFLAHDIDGTRRLGHTLDYPDGVSLWSPECTWLFVL